MFVEGAMRCRYAASADAAERALVSERETGWSTAAIVGDLAAALFYGPTPVPDAIGRCESLLAEADLGGEAILLLFLADLEAMREQPDAARSHLDRAEAFYAELGQGRFAVPICASHRAVVEMLAGNLDAAESALRARYEALETMGDRASLATCAAALAEVVCRSGRTEEANTWSRAAAKLVSDDDVPTQFLTRAVRARLLALQGDAENAEALAREAAALSSTTDSLSQRADVTLDLAEVLLRCGQTEQAVEVGTAALALYEQKGNLSGVRRARAFLGALAPG
jgi:tetratricopeptide (TPR) repeat protein